jgi:hypothetical protein
MHQTNFGELIGLVSESVETLPEDARGDCSVRQKK